MAALAAGLPPWGIPGTVSVAPGTNPAATSRRDREISSRPSGGARRADRRSVALGPAVLGGRIIIVPSVTADGVDPLRRGDVALLDALVQDLDTPDGRLEPAPHRQHPFSETFR